MPIDLTLSLKKGEYRESGNSCKRLKNQLATMDISFEEINIEEVAGTAEIVEKVNNGNRTVPTLVFSDGSAMTNPSAQQVADKLAELS